MADPVSETPRTDALMLTILRADGSIALDKAGEIEVHARDLERETAALREQVAKLEAELFTAEHEQGSLLTRAERAEARAEAVPEVLFDGYAVLQEVQTDSYARGRTSERNVLDVLDALVRIMRRTPHQDARREADAAELQELRKRELYQLMSDISEDCYCAGWMMGNEFRLWDAITKPDDDLRYGMAVIEPWQVERLKELSEKTGGWWVWEEDAAFISLDEWKRRLAALAQGGKP